MTIRLYKYHGTGNDFIMINGFDYPKLKLLSEEIESMCHRRFGVGADGLIILSKSKQFDFKMTYYNSDGNEGTMCGNGGRCSVAFARKVGLIQQDTRFEAIDGMHEAEIMNDNSVNLKMIDVSNIKRIDEGFLVDTGSPHFVVSENNLDEIDINERGRELRYDKRFGNDGVNVNFVQNDGHSIKVRTYERGVEAETYSCGTGAVAVALANYASSQQKVPESVIKTKGGELIVRFEVNSDKYSNICLIGPAEFVFQVEYDL